MHCLGSTFECCGIVMLTSAAPAHVDQGHSGEHRPVAAVCNAMSDLYECVEMS